LTVEIAAELFGVGVLSASLPGARRPPLTGQVLAAFASDGVGGAAFASSGDASAAFASDGKASAAFTSSGEGTASYGL
jgi:hypothetical protein